ncbi:MAG: toxin-antitoxin system YwqK family antitoxin [Flavobacteriales bacterium]|nr:toxin-antitoxin system YwqK family antitoxin [Flavobacteriales bacterium]
MSQSFEVEKGDTINRRDANEMRHGWWKIFNRDGKFKGYEEGQLVEEGEYINNKKNGIWTKYYPNGKKKHELTFTNNVANGYAKIYYRDGQLQEEGMWQQNKWAGQYKYYNENGNVKYDWSYNSAGKREGQQKYFHDNGVLMYLGEWKNGNEAGELVEYYEDGSVKTKRFFNNGKVEEEKTKELAQGKEFDSNAKKFSGKVQKAAPRAFGEVVDGYNKLFNSDGTISKEGEFKNKQLVDGKAYVYEGKRLVKIMVFKGGVHVTEDGSK